MKRNAFMQYFNVRVENKNHFHVRLRLKLIFILDVTDTCILIFLGGDKRVRLIDHFRKSLCRKYSSIKLISAYDF